MNKSATLASIQAGARPVRFVRCLILTSLMVTMGCSTLPKSKSVSVFDICGIDRAVWHQISVQQRAELLTSPDTRISKPVQGYFAGQGMPEEASFQNGAQDIVICGYSKPESCGGGAVNMGTMTRVDRAWHAGPTLTKICSE